MHSPPDNPEPTIAQRILEVEATIAEEKQKLTLATIAHEDALAFGSADGLKNAERSIAGLRSSIEHAERILRGLRRRESLEQRDILAASLAEAEAESKEAQAEYEETRRKHAEATRRLEELDRELRSSEIRRDMGLGRVSNRTQTLAKFIGEHQAELARAEQLVGAAVEVA